ncbi:trimethyltridecatetraene synthase-like [Humulus lupulus]|uniref:trimethyltridecatetraene synthase-like n=1 Tax=Humulus lupulus TaxID=3486 RepID=UPI002B412AEB|nr:trimethyltridecatetraene synthase-like [Humulus lupulus]
MEAYPFWAFVTFAILASVTIFISKLLNSSLKLPPPGPKPWPLIGNLNLIGPLPHQSLHKLSQKYGPIMQLKLGSFPVVVASSAEMAKLFLRTHDLVFASRPKTAAGKYTGYNYSNLTWSSYGPYWRQGRKIYLTELFSSKRLESYEYIRVEERREFLSRLFALSGKPTVLKDQLSRVTLSVISRIVLGKKYFTEPGEESPETTSLVKLEDFQEMLDELFLLNGVLNIGDWIPFLSFLDLQGYVKRMKDLKKRFDRFHDHVLDEHKTKREQGQKGNFVPKDMVDFLLELSENPDLEVKLSYDSIKAFIQDLIAGGTDTSATTVEWAMSELIKQPNLIEKAKEELDRIIGQQRWVEERDIPNLPYIDSIIKETMRKHPVAVFLAPHLAREDCHVSGYDIRKSTRVFINTWSLGRDPSVWDQPDEFRPERFLEPEKRGVDIKGQSFELLPFGSGRRMCPGYSLGLKMISSILANLLHGFTWKLPETMRAEDVGMEEVYGLATVRKVPFVAVMEPRLPVHLY